MGLVMRNGEGPARHCYSEEVGSLKVQKPRKGKEIRRTKQEYSAGKARRKRGAIVVRGRSMQENRAILSTMVEFTVGGLDRF